MYKLIFLSAAGHCSGGFQPGEFSVATLRDACSA